VNDIIEVVPTKIGKKPGFQAKFLAFFKAAKVRTQDAE
jgi:hypothetical protein